MDRRRSLGFLGTILTTLALPSVSFGTTARAVSLRDLVARSTRVVFGVPLEGTPRYEQIGETRHIVTYTRFRVDELLQGGPQEPEILVRTLGGRLGELGEIVHGEAELALNERCVMFVQAHPEGFEQVTAMAQGHYPMLPDESGALRLHASHNMAHLIGAPDSAAARLSGTKLADARSLIIGARR
ncbi:MAG: hypothetical protein ABJB12_09075 [Pseudomonadota bacterium]